MNLHILLFIKRSFLGNNVYFAFFYKIFKNKFYFGSIYLSRIFWFYSLTKISKLITTFTSSQRLFSFLFKAYLIQRPRIYLFVKLVCLRGFTKMGKTTTPTVKRQIGATTINIDSKDIIKILIVFIISSICF